MTTSAAAAVEAALGDPARRLAEWRVPAVEVAVVAGDESFATAFGVRGVDDASPVGPGTLFHHGSCAKAFTSLLAVLLAEEGAVDLDQPVRRSVPELRLPDPVLTERITLRDLLSHRSGLGRHDLAWILRPELSEPDLLDALTALTPAGDLRAGFEYSNFGYALAGVALSRADGQPWAELIRQRILEPAGMKQTVVEPFPGADAGPDRATPHLLRAGQPRPTAWRSIGVVSAAGQLVTCAEDAAAWLRLQLGQLPDAASRTAVTATHQPHVVLPVGINSHEPLRWIAYGLGWVTGTLRGRPVLWHSGGVDGFLTNILLLPDDGIGVAVSANLHNSDLPFALVHTIADQLLEAADGPSSYDWYGRVRADAEAASEPSSPPAGPAAATPSHPLPDFAADYYSPGYGTLHVAVADDALNASLEAGALQLRHRHYDTWDACYEPLDAQFTLTFRTDADGRLHEVVAPLDAGGSPVVFTRR